MIKIKKQKSNNWLVSHDGLYFEELVGFKQVIKYMACWLDRVEPVELHCNGRVYILNTQMVSGLFELNADWLGDSLSIYKA